MDKIVKELNGHSGCKVYLMQSDGLYVKKCGDVSRNVERLTTLNFAGYPVPKIYSYRGDELDMEYLHGLDMKTYLVHNNTKKLLKFITSTIDSFAKNQNTKDYTKTYEEKLDWLKDGEFPFTKEQLLQALPKKLPQTMYHGDMTLENIMYTDPGFHMIDAVTTEYDSYIFDIAKMRQDLECKWFLRRDDVRLDTKLQNIQDSLRDRYPEAFNDSFLILMLLRVIRYCEYQDENYNFLMKEIVRLWK
jgi:tRNA A-37 threonylcarbamoyl transferase component Bud32